MMIYHLAAAQQRSVAGLLNERQAIVDRAKERTAQINAALEELADKFRPDLPGAWFEKRGGEIVLVVG